MQFNTTFSCGDKAWIFGTEPQQVTIGQIRIEYTDSTGSGDDDEMFDNYKPQKGYKEVYMCIETGIGSGTLWELGKTIFATEAECISANKVKIEERNKELERRRKQALEDANYALRQAQIRINELSKAPHAQD